MKFERKYCQESERKVELFLKQLHDEGRGVPGVSPAIDPNIPPAWFDPVLFSGGQKFAKQYTIRFVTCSSIDMR